jgi:dCTP deaminase
MAVDRLCTESFVIPAKAGIPLDYFVHRKRGWIPACAGMTIDGFGCGGYADAMSIQSDRWIREQAQANGMIEPFVEAQRREGCISYGLSSYGYDARVADEFKIFTNVDSAVVDPKDFAANSFVDRRTDVCIIPPNSFALARTVEYFRIPRDVLVICLGKSTYARCGIIVNVTPLEPGWEGHVTLEFSNTTPLPAKVYANEGACQFLFLAGNEPCEVSYADRAGKYMGQRGVTLPKL